MTAQKIQEVALKYFSQQGYDGTSLSEIAEEVGIKKPSIYAHYHSKQDLFLAVVQKVAEDYYSFWQVLLGEIQNLGCEQQLYHLFKSVISYFSNDRIKIGFLVRTLMFPTAGSREAVQQILKVRADTLLVQVSNIFEQGIKDGVIHQGVAKDMTYAYFCLLDGYLMRYICSYDDDLAQHAPQIWQSFWLGLKK